MTGLRLLDAGCGTGALAIAAAERGAEVVAIDVARSLVRVARDAQPGGPRDRLAGRRHARSRARTLRPCRRDGLADPLPRVRYRRGAARSSPSGRSGSIALHLRAVDAAAAADACRRQALPAQRSLARDRAGARAAAAHADRATRCQRRGSGATRACRRASTPATRWRCVPAMSAQPHARAPAFWNKIGTRFLPFADAAPPDLPLGRAPAAVAVPGVGRDGGGAADRHAQPGDDRRARHVGEPRRGDGVAAAALRAAARADRLQVRPSRSVLGWKRVPYIWFGTLLQFGGLAILPFALSGDDRATATARDRRAYRRGARLPAGRRGHAHDADRRPRARHRSRAASTSARASSRCSMSCC